MHCMETSLPDHPDAACHFPCRNNRLPKLFPLHGFVLSSRCMPHASQFNFLTSQPSVHSKQRERKRSKHGRTRSSSLLRWHRSSVCCFSPHEANGMRTSPTLLKMERYHNLNMFSFEAVKSGYGHTRHVEECSYVQASGC